MILGESGSGKSTSLRNFENGQIGIFNVASKPLPFRKRLSVANGANYQTITKSLCDNNLKAYAIDDSQFLMVFDSFEKANETGYQKFTSMAVNFYNTVQTVIKKTTDDTIVYFLHHTERTDDGHIKAKTIGKMLDSQLSLEGMFSVVLLCKTEAGRHFFSTQSDGYNTAKSPIDMFDAEKDNDLRFVDTAIREYWNLPQLTSK